MNTRINTAVWTAIAILTAVLTIFNSFYPLDAFNPEKVYESLGEEYAIIIKLHPFCKERFEIDEKYKDFIIDLSEEDELNDLLFVTDLLVTDY